MAELGASDLLGDLTWPQKDAVCHLDGPLLIIAAAGSGKTRVITRRIAYMLQQGIRAYNILAITFTNKAANEMKERVESLVPGNKAWISTFHSLGARLLRQYGEQLGLDKNFTIYDTDDRNKVVKRCLELANLDDSKFTPEAIGSAISKAKNQLLTPEKYAAQASDYFKTTVAEVYGRYQQLLRKSNALDFDDLLYIPALGMRLNPDFCQVLAARFKYIMIDEYQDTNAAQYEMARMLCQLHQNICVVGDPDQSIYRWRGSDIKNILDFERDFAQARVITLDTNFRSTPEILRAADTLIQHNRVRKPKKLITDNRSGEPVRVLSYDTGADEATLIAQEIKKAVTDGKYQYRDVAIFVRMNALTRALETALTYNQVPFQIVKGLGFFERKENKDVIAYLRLLVNPADNISLLRVVNEPARGIGKVSLDHLQTFADENQLSLFQATGQVAKIPAIKGKAAKALGQFHQLLLELQGKLALPIDKVVQAVLDETGYRKMLRESDNDEDRDRLANVEELVTFAQQVAEEDPERSLGDFLEQITLASDIDNWNDSTNIVSIMTLHASKGLEFPIVYMVALEQGILPGQRSLEAGKNDDLEEERRVCFVGMTRAMKQLNMCYARVRDFRGQRLYAIPSMFLDELPNDTLRLDLGAHGGRIPSFDQYRGGSSSARSAWGDTGIKPSEAAQPPLPRLTAPGAFQVSSVDEIQNLERGQLVQEEQYGIGTVTEVSGLGSLRKIKIQFAVGGLKTFMLNKVKLKVVVRKTT